jgi:hypothetical protein
MKAIAIPLLAVLAAPAGATTITVGGPADPGTSTAIDLDVEQFEGFGECGSGGSVVGNGCSVIEKVDPDLPDAFGRFDPFGQEWIDSQDLSHVVWSFEYGEAFTSLTFALTDAFDQTFSQEFGESYFRLEVDGEEWSIPSIEANGTLHWITVLFDAPTTSAQLSFFTRLNDGWGVSSASIASVPVPASLSLLLLALAGLGGIAGSRGRRSGPAA